MPKFLKDGAIALLDGGVETYLLALYGMSIPSTRLHRKQEIKYAPVVGLLGVSAELLVKACLVQANGLPAMFRDGDVASGVYRFGNEVIEDLRKELREEVPCISYIWKSPDNHEDQKEKLIYYLHKFKLLQVMRANGLHAGCGCSRDITVSTANDLYSFIQLLSQSKKLRAYLKNIPAPEATIRDREVIIEDLTRRMNSSKDTSTKAECLRNMYLVLPYIPEIQPDWIDIFDKIAVAPPTERDVSYLAKTLTDAHSIYLLKNRGGKDGVPVRIEPENPNALPIAIQNIKRTLNTIPDKFNNDLMAANTRLEEKRLDLPIDDFLIDLYALGLENAGILTAPNKKLTAQQVWPYVAAAYSTQGTPRPCWFFVRTCDEIEQLIAYLRRAETIGNGYFKRRINSILNSLQALKDNTSVDLRANKEIAFKELAPYAYKVSHFNDEQLHPFTPTFLRRFPLRNEASAVIHEFVIGNKNAGDTLASILKLEKIDESERKAALALMPLCFDVKNKNGLIAVLRTSHLQGYASQARKMMFFADFFENGPRFIH